LFTSKKAATANHCGFLSKAESGLTLRELLTTTGTVQTDLFTFHFTGIARDETSLA
jgi:hypothetical protein